MFLPLDAYRPVGAALGAAGGAGILGGALGLAGQALSYPRRALWGAFGLPDSGTEVLHQYAGMDPDSAWTKALGMGVEMAGDPLTWLGEGLGGVTGALKGAGFGADLAEQALAKGPQYAGGIEKLMGAPGMAEAAAGNSGRASSLGFRLEDLAASQGINRALAEVPPGSSYLGHGVEGLALRTPAGDVLRLEPPVSPYPSDPEVPPDLWNAGIGETHGLARPDIPEMLQPNRAGMAGDIKVERLPLADTSGLRPPPTPRLERFVAAARGENPDMTPEAERAIGQLSEALQGRGWEFTDAHAGNIGRVGGEYKVLDPGAINPLGEAPPPGQLSQIGQGPGGVRDWLLRALGSDQAVQARLAAQAGGPTEASAAMASLRGSPVGAFWADDSGALDMNAIIKFMQGGGAADALPRSVRAAFAGEHAGLGERLLAEGGGGLSGPVEALNHPAMEEGQALRNVLRKAIEGKDVQNFPGTTEAFRLEHAGLPSPWENLGRGVPGRVAGGIASEADNSSLPVLADALEEAGYSNPSVLSQMRTRPEFTGWILDALLGRGGWAR